MVWKLVSTIKEYLDKCKRDNIGAFAAQAAFFMIMSAIPFTMVFTSLLQYTPISEEYVIHRNYFTVGGCCPLGSGESIAVYGFRF